MDILPLSFRTCRWCGVWYEDYRKHLILKIMCRTVVLSLMLYFTISLLIGSFTHRTSVGDLAESLFIVLTFSTLCLKLFNFVLQRNNMINLLNNFRQEICKPRSPDENEILQKYKSRAGQIYVYFMSLSMATGLALVIVPLLKSIPATEFHFPLKLYQLVEVTNWSTYSWNYGMQVWYFLFGVVMNVSFDSMTYGFISLATGQFELCSHRLRNAGRAGGTAWKENIVHHILIQDIVKKIESIFIGVIVPFFFCSMITLCSSIFQMSQKQAASAEFLSLVLYLICMLYQIFLYCWHGTELELKSQELSNAAYESDWLDLKSSERKKLWLIMILGQKGTTISYHGQCRLCINTFVWIVKTSYGAFNIIQQASR